LRSGRIEVIHGLAASWPKLFRKFSVFGVQFSAIAEQ